MSVKYLATRISLRLLSQKLEDQGSDIN